MQESYEWLTNIESLKFGNKSVLLIGGGDIVKQYSLALLKMNIKDITVIAKTGKNISKFCNEKGISLLTGGFEKKIPMIDKKDLVIIATPIPLLLTAAQFSIQHGQTNILIEKPGSLYHKKLSSLAKKITSQKIRIAYNRLVYPSLHKLKLLAKNDGGITSCRFTFTEWIDRIKFKASYPEVYRRWGISNSLHVISMATEIIGFPKEIHSYQYGKIDWHKSGSIFVGNGVTKQNIPFSYHADWGSGGRWGIEIMTKKNSYQLIPLEEISVCPKGTSSWSKMPIRTSFPDVKPGIAEEIAVMLSGEFKNKIELVSLEKAAEYNRLAENIFGYNSTLD